MLAKKATASAALTSAVEAKKDQKAAAAKADEEAAEAAEA